MEVVRDGAGGMPMTKQVEPIEPGAETKNEKQEVLQEILETNPNEHTHEDGTTHSHDGGDVEHTHDEFDEDVTGEEDEDV